MNNNLKFIKKALEDSSKYNNIRLMDKNKSLFIESQNFDFMVEKRDINFDLSIIDHRYNDEYCEVKNLNAYMVVKMILEYD